MLRSGGRGPRLTPEKIRGFEYLAVCQTTDRIFSATCREFMPRAGATSAQVPIMAAHNSAVLIHDCGITSVMLTHAGVLLREWRVIGRPVNLRASVWGIWLFHQRDRYYTSIGQRDRECQRGCSKSSFSDRFSLGGSKCDPQVSFEDPRFDFVIRCMLCRAVAVVQGLWWAPWSENGHG